jgi:hypothetical protein
MNDGQNGLIPRESIQDIYGRIPTVNVLYAIKYFGPLNTAVSRARDFTFI